MDLNDFVSNFAEQFDETDLSEIRADTVYKELNEWSSMVALSVIAMIDAEYNVQLKGTDIYGSNTVEDLFNRVKNIRD